MVPPMALSPGLSAAATLTVGEDDTAIALGSGDVPVLATPRMIALAEGATLAALDNHLQPGETTVGVRVQVDHLAPSPVGAEIRAEATLEKVEGRRLTFTVSISDGRGLVGAGRVTRVLVETERFLEKTR